MLSATTSAGARERRALNAEPNSSASLATLTSSGSVAELGKSREHNAQQAQCNAAQRITSRPALVYYHTGPELNIPFFGTCLSAWLAHLFKPGTQMVRKALPKLFDRFFRHGSLGQQEGLSPGYVQVEHFFVLIRPMQSSGLGCGLARVIFSVGLGNEVVRENSRTVCLNAANVFL